MKRIATFSVLFLATALLHFSCSSDSEEVDNIIAFGEQQFKLYSGVGYKYADASDAGHGTPYVVLLMGEGVSYDAESGALSGTGALIRTFFYSSNTAEVANGEYVIDIFSSHTPFTADSCKVYFNYDFARDTGRVYTIRAGMFKVENLGKVMQFDIDIQTLDMTHFKGEYRGAFTAL